MSNQATNQNVNEAEQLLEAIVREYENTKVLYR